MKVMVNITANGPRGEPDEYDMGTVPFDELPTVIKEILYDPSEGYTSLVITIVKAGDQDHGE